MPPAPPNQRRRLLAAACALCGTALPARAAGPGAGSMDPRVAALIAERRSLWVRRGGEEARVTYWTAAGGRDQNAYLELCWLLRDVRADRVFAMDRGLLDTLAALQAWLAAGGIKAPLQIHSGYRTQRTNNLTEGAALNSRHVIGQAADISVEGVSGVRLAGMSSLLGRGGTGFYVGRGFVHVDTGDERIWVDQKRKPAGG